MGAPWKDVESVRSSLALSGLDARTSRRNRAVAVAVATLCAAGVVVILASPRTVARPAHGSDLARHEARGTDALSSSSSPFVDGAGALTLAGTGAAGSSGGDAVATSAELDGPGGIAEDRQGDLFIADTDNCNVREVPSADGVHYSVHMTAGHIYAIAGGPCGNGGSSASTAGKHLSGFPTSVAVDSAGDVFVADSTTNEVLELPAASGRHFAKYMGTGRLSVVAGDGSPGDTGNGQLASTAELDGPVGVGVDPAGDLFIADTESCEVREVAAGDGAQWGIPMLAGRIYTVAGTGTCGETGDGGPADHAELWDPVDVAVGPVGDLLVSDGGGDEILDLPARSGTYYGAHIAADHLAVVAGIGMYGPYLVDGLPATGQTAELNSPAQIAVDATGDLYIADTYSSCIREVPAGDTTQLGRALTGGDMYTVAGALQSNLGDSTAWTGPEMLYPVGIALAPSGAVVYSDQGANVVRELSRG